MFRTVAEIYENPDIRARASQFQDIYYDGRIEGCLEKASHLGSLATPEAVLSYVESLPDYDNKQQDRMRAASLLGSLPADILVSNFGLPITAWTYGNDRDYRAASLAQDLATEGFDPDLLVKAKSLAIAESKDLLPSGNSLLRHHRTMQALLDGAQNTVDLPEAIQRSALGDIKFSASRLNDYELHPLRAPEGFRGYGRVYEWPGKDELTTNSLSYKLWVDTPTGLGLFYKGVPQLEIGAIANGDDELQIRQMQRVYGRRFDPSDPNKGTVGFRAPRGLAPLDWKKVAVDITAQLASHLELGSVGIIAGGNVPGNTVHMSKEQAIAVYDKGAEELAFARADDGNWHRPTHKLVA